MAAGRVWLGFEAKKHTLVDHRLDCDAINAAAKAAQRSLTSMISKSRPSRKCFFARLPGFFEADTLGIASVFKALPIIFDPLIKAWSQPILLQAGTPLALLPWTVEDNSSMGSRKSTI